MHWQCFTEHERLRNLFHLALLAGILATLLSSYITRAVLLVFLQEELYSYVTVVETDDFSGLGTKVLAWAKVAVGPTARAQQT